MLVNYILTHTDNLAAESKNAVSELGMFFFPFAFFPLRLYFRVKKKTGKAGRRWKSERESGMKMGRVWQKQKQRNRKRVREWMRVNDKERKFDSHFVKKIYPLVNAFIHLAQWLNYRVSILRTWPFFWKSSRIIELTPLYFPT